LLELMKVFSGRNSDIARLTGERVLMAQLRHSDYLLQGQDRLGKPSFRLNVLPPCDPPSPSHRRKHPLNLVEHHIQHIAVGVAAGEVQGVAVAGLLAADGLALARSGDAAGAAGALWGLGWRLPGLDQDRQEALPLGLGAVAAC
jgi:hypothetical protein